jgi:hypothetical protein
MTGSVANARIGLAVRVLIAAGLFFSSLDVVGQSTAAGAATSSPSAKDETKRGAASNQQTGVEVLTDTQGSTSGRISGICWQ